MMFFVSIASIVIKPFICSPHPNEQWTFRVIQMSCVETHSLTFLMIATGTFAFIYVIALIALCSDEG